jgi:site-specific DNA-methyltransferase (adenine-specific)
MQLIHGDCLVEMSNITDHSVDLILCDLPYGTTACKWDVVIPFEPLWLHYWKILKPNGAIVLFGSEPFSSYLRMSQIKYYKYDWIWEKDKGSNIGISRKQPLRKHELLSVFYKQPPFYDYKGKELDKAITRVLPLNKNETTRLNINNNGDIANRVFTTYTHEVKKSVIYFCRDNQKDESFHPTQKPVALLEYLIKTYTVEGKLYLITVWVLEVQV